MSENKGYYLQSDPNYMDLYYLEYNGERAPENIQFVYSRNNIHELEDLIELLNKKNDECITLDRHVSFLDEMNLLLERRNENQKKHLEEIYNLIENKKWDRLISLHMSSKRKLVE